MVLPDTSVWISHFRYREPELANYLSEGTVLMHPWVTGDLACGNLKDRRLILSHFYALPSARLASDAEALGLLERRKLWGRGLGWIDVHLLVSALLSSCRLWTLDKRLALAAAELKLD